jgi:hypothetical protein
MISVGAVVTCRQTANVAWVARRKLDDGRWLLIGKAMDQHGRATYSSRTAGEGDLQEVTPAPSYEEGTTITFESAPHTVQRDLGTEVELIVPANRHAHSSGVTLHVAGGNIITVSKADITLETLK